MISRRDIDLDAFMQVMKSSGQSKKVTEIDRAIAIADEGDHWTAEFLENATLIAKKAAMRRLFRHGYVDADGNKREFLNIEETDPKTGEVKKGYKQFTFFTVGNWEWAIRDARQRIDVETERFEKICRMAVKACPEVQNRFDFLLPVGQPTEV